MDFANGPPLFSLQNCPFAREIWAPSNAWLLEPKRHLDRFNCFTELMTLTDRRRYSVFNNRTYLRSTAMRPIDNKTSEFFAFPFSFFFTAERYAGAEYAMALCLSVCPSVAIRCSVKRATHSITQTTLHNSPAI